MTSDSGKQSLRASVVCELFFYLSFFNVGFETFFVKNVPLVRSLVLEGDRKAAARTLSFLDVFNWVSILLQPNLSQPGWIRSSMTNFLFLQWRHSLTLLEFFFNRKSSAYPSAVTPQKTSKKERTLQSTFQESIPGPIPAEHKVTFRFPRFHVFREVCGGYF